MRDPFVVAAVLLPLLIVLIVVRAMHGAPSQDRRAISTWIREHLALMLVTLAGVGVLPGATALLWGFRPAFYLSGIFFVGSLSTVLFGGFGAGWVGPGAARREEQDRGAALIFVGPSLIYTILFFVLSHSFQFGGFFPWPSR